MKHQLKYLLALLFLSISLLTVRAQSHPLFERAVKSYQEEDFFNSQKLLDSLYQSGYQSPGLHYNLANAYFRLGELGEAILHYEKCLVLEPGDKDAMHNLEYAQSLRIDEFKSVGEPFYQSFLNKTVFLITTDSWAKMGLFLMLISIVSYSFFVFARHKTFRKLGYFLAGTSLFLAILASFLSFLHYQIKEKNLRFVVTEPNCYVKNAPEDKAEDLFILHEGTDLSILQKQQEWIKIELADGKIGWLLSASGDQI